MIINDYRKVKSTLFLFVWLLPLFPIEDIIKILLGQLLIILSAEDSENEYIKNIKKVKSSLEVRKIWLLSLNIFQVNN